VNFQKTIQDHQVLINHINEMENEIVSAAQLIGNTIKKGGKLFLMGNGGSAADAQHIAAELVVRYHKKRPAQPAIALTTDTSIITAIGNDFGFDQLFSRQVQALVRPEDIVVGISTSGKSANVLLGVQAAIEIGAKTIMVTGMSGGELCHISDILIAVPSSVTARIQEAHILIGHIWCDQIEEEWF